MLRRLAPPAASGAKVSLVCSLALLALLLSPLGAAPLLRLYVGGGDTAGPILAPATAYVRLRSLALPAALVGNCLQAALLGAQVSHRRSRAPPPRAASPVSSARVIAEA